MTVTSRVNPSEGKCQLLPTLNYLTFNLELCRKKILLLFDWKDAYLVRGHRTRVHFEHCAAQNECQKCSSIKCSAVHVTLTP